MEFSLGSLMSDLGIEAQVDCILENERRFYKGDFNLQDTDNINEINTVYSKEALLATDPEHFTYISGEACSLPKVPVLVGYKVLLTWDVYNDEPRTGLAGWIYKKSFYESSKCSNSPKPDSLVRFRSWKRVQVKNEDFDFVSFLVNDRSSNMYSRYHSYNLNFIQSALMGLPYKLQLTYENLIISGKANSGKGEMPDDPPYWTVPMYSGYVDPKVRSEYNNKSRNKSNKSNSNSNSNNINSNSNSNNSATNDTRGRRDTHSFEHPSANFIDVDEYDNLNQIVEDAFEKYNKDYIDKCYPYCEIKDGSNFVVKSDWMTVRGFNFIVNSKTDLNGWQYADSFWLTNTDGSEILDATGNRVEQPNWYSSSEVDTTRYMEAKTSSVATFFGSQRSPTDTVDLDLHDASSVGAHSGLNSPTRSRANTATSHAQITGGVKKKKFKRPVDMFKDRLLTLQSRDKDILSKDMLTPLRVKRRLWCRILVPKMMFTKMSSMMNVFISHHPRGLIYSGPLKKRGAIVNSWRERTHELRDTTIMYFKDQTKKGTIYITNGSVRKINKSELEKLNREQADALSIIQRALSKRQDFTYGFVIESAQLDTDDLFNRCGIVKKLSTIEEGTLVSDEEDAKDDISTDDGMSVDSDSGSAAVRKSRNSGTGMRVPKFKRLSLARSQSTSPPLGINRTIHDDAITKEKIKTMNDNDKASALAGGGSATANENENGYGNDYEIDGDPSDSGGYSSHLNEDALKQIPVSKKLESSDATFGPNSYHSHHSKNSKISTASKTSFLSVWSMQAAGIDCPDLIIVADSEKVRTMWFELIQSQISFASNFKIFDVDGAPAFFPTIPTELIMDESDGPIGMEFKSKINVNNKTRKQKMTTNDLLIKLKTKTYDSAVTAYRGPASLLSSDMHFEFEEYQYYTEFKQRHRLALLAVSSEAQRTIDEAAALERKKKEAVEASKEEGRPATNKEESGIKKKRGSLVGFGLGLMERFDSFTGSGFGSSSDDDITIGVKNTKNKKKDGDKGKEKIKHKEKDKDKEKDKTGGERIGADKSKDVAGETKTGGNEASASAKAATKQKEESNVIITKTGVCIPVSYVKGAWFMKKFVEESGFKKRFIWIDQNNNGHWYIYWSKEAKKPKYPDVPKGFAAKEIDSCTVGTLKEPRKNRPLICFASPDEVQRTVSIWTKSKKDLFGIDLLFPHKELASKFSEIINELMKA